MGDTYTESSLFSKFEIGISIELNGQRKTNLELKFNV